MERKSWDIGLLTGNRQAVTRTMTTVSAQHAATFGKSIAGQRIMYSFVAKETITIKRKTIWKSYQSKERPLKRWSPSSTISSVEWMPSAIGTGKRQ